MKTRTFNWPIVVAPVLSAAAFISYPFVFLRWPLTRNFPWANLVLFAVAGVLAYVGLQRGFAPGRFRVFRIIVSTALTALSGLIFWSFASVVFVGARQLPASAGAPEVGQKAPDFRLLDVNNRTVSLSDLLSASPEAAASPITASGAGANGVLLIFYMHDGCLSCNSELHGIQEALPRFTEQGIRPVAISADTPDKARTLSQEAGYAFTFLSDPNKDAIRRYDLLDDRMGMARPAAFLVDTTGTVRWRNVTKSVFVRSRPEEILEAAAALSR